MKNIRFILTIFALGFVLTACTKPSASESIINNQNNMTNEQNSNTQVQDIKTESEQGTVVKYDLAEVAKHAQATDCWLASNGRVYNVTDFVGKHPGGEAILQGCGKDMSEFFNTKHAKQSKEKLPEFYIGDLKE